MLVFHFDDAMAGMTAEDFVTKKLIGELGAAGVVTGEDFTFGKGRSGNVQRLAELGTRYSLRTESVAPVMGNRSEEHTSELQSLMRISYAVSCCKKKHENQ